MADSAGIKYANYLNNFRAYYENNPSDFGLSGYGPTNGKDSLTGMNTRNYGKALGVFSCVDSSLVSGRHSAVARQPAILCAAFLVNNCPLTEKMKPYNVALLAQHLYLFDENDFKRNLILLGNDALLDRIVEKIPDDFDQPHACYVVTEHAEQSGVDVHDEHSLSAFWVDEMESISRNPEPYLFNERAINELLVHMEEHYPQK